MSAGFYTQSGRLLLFIATGLVIAAVVIALLRWISHLTDFGRMEDTLERVEEATAESLARRMERPLLGGAPQREAPPADAQPVLADTTGYVQHIDMEQVCDVARDLEAQIWVRALPGCVVHPAAPLFLVVGATADDDRIDQLRAAVTCSETRSFDQDPRFGLIVLSEIASRALSPGVNDQGTAIGVIGRLVRVLAAWRAGRIETPEFPEVIVPPIAVEDLLVDAFRPIARDGAGVIEVQIRLQKAFRALSEIAPETFAKAAEAVSRDALGRAEAAGLPESEVDTLRTLALTGD